MRILILFPAIGLLNWYHHPASDHRLSSVKDTAIINHVQDGVITEWSDSGFQTNKETGILYSADNDAQNLYVAMKIPDFRMQTKLMRMGMNLYIDLKGKKKESRGIEFPIKRESEGGFSGGGGFSNQQTNQQTQEGNQQKGFDKKAMRSRYAIYMLSMKLFGFSDEEPAAQSLEVEGSVNLAFSWDANDVMYVEYLIPLKMLGDAGSLNQKTISLGWKINGVEISSSFSSNAPTTTSTRRVVTVPSGSSPGVNQGNVFSGGGPNQGDMDKMMQEQSFWTKYTFH